MIQTLDIQHLQLKRQNGDMLHTIYTVSVPVVEKHTETNFLDEKVQTELPSLKSYSLNSGCRAALF